ncbi:MAG: tetratricopeptide repeat protein [Bacteroidales bacterium]|nr:tetratricopeptide repeat protein [Bacteroidales bacterium]
MQKYIYLLLSCILCVSVFAGNSDKLTGQDKLKFDYFFLESLRLKQKGEMTHAYNALQHALHIDSTSAAALYEISNYYFELGNNSLGLQAIQQAVKNSPDNFEYKLALADLYRQTGQVNEAIQIYEELVKKDPQNLELYISLTELYLQGPTVNVEKAINALNGLENNIGINEFISMQKYQLYMTSGNKEKAVKEIDKLIQKFPAEAKYLILLGDFYLSENQKETALSFYNRAIKIDPNNPFYFLSMANYYEMEGKEEEAIIQIENALKNPGLAIEMKLGILSRYIQTLYRSKKNMDAVDSLFKTLMEQHTQEKELNTLYGQFLLTQGKIEEAKFQFQVVTEATPEELTAWMPLLEIAIQENNADEIISLCNRAMVHFPDVPEFYFYKATAYMLKKDLNAALETYTEGLEYIPDDKKALQSTFYGQMGDIFFQLGNKKEAYSNYEKAIQLNNMNVNVLNNYAYQLAVNKESLDKAERLSATAVQLQPESSTYLDTYAWVFFQKENYSLAKFYIESAISKEKNPGRVLYEHYGDILYKTGDVDKAVSQWEKALSMEQDSQEETNEEILRKKINDRTYYEE